MRFVRLMACLLAVALPAGAQPPRSRTMTYHPDRREWVEVAGPTPGTAEGDLHAIRLQIKDEQYRLALRAIETFVEEYGQDHSTYPALLIATAEAQIGRRDYHQAHLTLQGFLGQYAGMALTSDVLRLEFMIAETFLSGVKRRVWGMRLFSGEDVALRILDAISTEYPDSRLVELAIKTKADYFFGNGDYSLAELEYARLLRDHPHSRYHQQALQRSAAATLASFGGVEYDEAALVDADERYNDFRARYPAEADREGVGSVLDTIRETRAERDFSIGSYYERTGHISTAIFYYQSVVEDWLETLAATKAMARLTLLGVPEAVGPAHSSSPTDRAGQPAKRASP